MNGTSIRRRNIKKNILYIYFNVKSLWVAAIQATKYEKMVKIKENNRKKIVEQGIEMEDGKNMKNCDNFTGQQKWKYSFSGDTKLLLFGYSTVASQNPFPF